MRFESAGGTRRAGALKSTFGISGVARRSTGTSVRCGRSAPVLSFDAITAWRVFGLQMLAKSDPDELASRIVDPEEIEICQILLISMLYRTLSSPAPHDLIVREHADQVGKLAGFLPTGRQPLRGNRLPWLGMVELPRGVRSIRAYRRLKTTTGEVGG
ncbi:MAG: hypothetical protein F4X92_07400 [Gammaproteobacteria bacterium]|nr:hypothetical protein [Gammaproteobacteria bacterium]